MRRIVVSIQNGLLAEALTKLLESSGNFQAYRTAVDGKNRTVQACVACSADIVLMRNDLRGVPAALALSNATMRIIKENLFWAFIYNIVCIPLAAGVFYPLFGWSLNPAFASLAMAFSSVSVVSNALRLRKFQENSEDREAWCAAVRGITKNWT